MAITTRLTKSFKSFEGCYKSFLVIVLAASAFCSLPQTPAAKTKTKQKNNLKPSSSSTASQLCFLEPTYLPTLSADVNASFLISHEVFQHDAEVAKKVRTQELETGTQVILKSSRVFFESLVLDCESRSVVCTTQVDLSSQKKGFCKNWVESTRVEYPSLYPRWHKVT